MREMVDYLREEVDVRMRRIEVLAITGALVLALRHPDLEVPTALVMRVVGRRLCLLVDRCMSVEVLAEWVQVLCPEGREGAG